MLLAHVTERTDVHAHLVPPPYLRHLRDRPDHPAVRAHLPWLLPFAEHDADALVAGMDAAGVDVSWVSLPPPGVVADDARTAAVRARELNDVLAEAAAEHPGRLLPVPLLPLAHPAACAEILDGLPDCPAVTVHLRPSGTQPDDPEFRPVLAELQARGLPLFLHPGVEPLTPLAEPWSLAGAVSAPTATTLALARLVHSGTLDALPGLTLVLPHLGGALPALLTRLEDQARGQARHGLRHYLTTRTVLDSACFDPHALRWARAALPGARIVLGSDAPFRGPLTRAVDVFASIAGPLTVPAPESRRAG
ncbi:amidohydrolase family protein [Streptomyces sp. DSM 44917]|uniref:Amidohydrolase family protein n=1 Tax=Streptomyces boetiae TaxID=3075541 RepID=A0ABU2L6Y1_9ACTN|nr:amidohydrolase family protein [Streptomyces sp. DSM 44917]MDT0307326.1 amidohydrolase family protein [Streptomyces sp. DSM 44917]